MARSLEIRKVCELALQKIGSFSINDTGARANEMERAREWLDMVVGHICATQRRWWMVENTGSVVLQDGVDSYSLAASLGVPSESIEFVIGVWRTQPTGGERVPVEIMRRQEWEARTILSGGPPAQVYIDRSNTPTMLVSPVPAAPISYGLDLVWQSFVPDLTSGPETTKLSKIRKAWNLALVHALAAELGDGPIRKLPADEVRDMQRTATRLLDDLDAYENLEHADEPRRVEYNDF